MIKYDEDTIITGCEDGLIRALSVLPNKIVAILGDPLDTNDEVFHIQKVTLSHDKKLLASCSLDDIVKIIDVSNLESRIKDDFDEEEYERSVSSKLKANHGKITREESKVDNDKDWEDASGDEDMSDDSDDDSDDSDDSDDNKK